MDRITVLLELKEEAESNIEFHRKQAELYLKEPLSIGQHASVKTAVAYELDIIGKYVNYLDLLDTYFIK